MAKSTLPASRSSEGRRPSSGAAPPAGALAPDPPPAPAAEGGAKRQCCALEWSDAVTLPQVAMLALVLVFLLPTAAAVPPPLWDICTEDTRGGQTMLHQVRVVRRSGAAKNCTWGTHMSCCGILGLLQGFSCSPRRKNRSPQKRVSQVSTGRSVPGARRPGWPALKRDLTSTLDL